MRYNPKNVKFNDSDLRLLGELVQSGVDISEVTFSEKDEKKLYHVRRTNLYFIFEGSEKSPVYGLFKNSEENNHRILVGKFGCKELDRIPQYLK